MLQIERFKVKGIPFEDENWEDQSIHGWMTFFLISLSLGVIFSIAPIYQDRFIPLWYKLIAILPFLYGAYVVLAFFLRLKDAVYSATIYLSSLILNNLSMVLVGQFTYQAATMNFSSVWAIILGLIWIVYLYSSKLVKYRFPKEQRKMFVIDYVLGGVVILLSISSIVLSIIYNQYVS